MLKRLKSLAGQSLVYGLGGLLPKAIGFLLIPLYTQFLSPADYGIIAFTTTIGSVLVIFYEVGLGGAVTRFHYDYLDKPKEQRSFYGTVWIFITAVSLLLTLLLTWRGETLFSELFRETPFQPYGLYTVWISFFTTASVIPLMLYRVREQPFFYTLFTVGRFLITTLGIVYFVAVLKRGAEGSLLGQLLGGLLFFIPFLWISLRNSNIDFSLDKLKATLAFGLPLIPHQLSGWALSVSDRILLERFVSLDQLGLYSLGYRLAMILDLILYSINLSWSPFFYRTAATEGDAPKTFSRITTYFTVFMLLIGLGVALLAKDVIRIMAKPAFLDAFRVVPIVVLAYVSHGFYYMLVNQLFYAKKTRRLPVYTLISAVSNIGLNLMLLPKYGIIAAAWNTVVGYTVLTVLVYIDSRKVYPIPYEYRRIGIALLAAGATYLLANQIDIVNAYLSILVRSFATLIFPTLLYLLRFFTTQEINGLRSIPRRLRTKFSNPKLSNLSE